MASDNIERELLSVWLRIFSFIGLVMFVPGGVERHVMLEIVVERTLTERYEELFNLSWPLIN